MPNAVNVPHAMGDVLANLQSIEFCLRRFLYHLDGLQKPSPDAAHPPFDLSNWREGDWVPETPLTNYDTLGDLIAKVNSALQARGFPERIDTSLTQLRDALAHGRVLSLPPDGPFRLVKFSKPKVNKVRVAVSITLNHEWLRTGLRRTKGEIDKIMRLSQKLGQAAFGP